MPVGCSQNGYDMRRLLKVSKSPVEDRVRGYEFIQDVHVHEGTGLHGVPGVGGEVIVGGGLIVDVTVVFIVVLVSVTSNETHEE